MRREIPASWAWAPLSDLGSWYGGGTPSKSNPAYWEGGTIPWVSPKDMKVGRIWDSEDHITAEAIKNSATTLIPPGAVLIVTRSGILRHTVPVAVTEVAVTINQDLKALVPYGGMSATYIAYALRAFESEILSRATKSGTTVQSIETPILRSLEIPVAPSAEQERIVEEIEKQITRIEAATAGLRRAQAKLKTYRAAVLKGAFEGRLVTTEAELGKLERRTYETAEILLKRIQKGHAPEISPSPSADYVPTGWASTSLGNLFYVSVGATPSRSRPDFWQGTIPWVSSGEIAFNRIRHTRENITEAGLQNTSTEVHPSGTVLLAMIGEGKTRGQAAILDIEACNNQNSAAIRVSETEIPPEYVYYFLAGQYLRTRRLGSGNNQPALNKKKVQAIPVPIAPLAEQFRIVAELDRLISSADKIEDIIKDSLSRAAKLKLAILEKAFQGKLVPQLEREESAEILLGRIRMRAESTRPQRGRGIKPGVSTPDSEPQHPPKPRRGAGNNVHESAASAPSGLPGESGDASLGLKPQALGHGPFRAMPTGGHGVTRERSSATGKTEAGQDFLGLSREEQIDQVWESLLGLGAVEKDEAIRTVANDLREKGLAQFQRLRQGGVLYEAIASAINRGVRAGSFDRPRRGTVRALLPDAREYSPEEWRRCLLESLNHQVVEEDALRAAAEWARENMGLEFSRLREDGIILRGLREALNDAVRRGEIQRKRGQIYRAPNKSGPTGRESLAQG